MYKGHMRKSVTSASNEERAAGQSILFTNDRRVVARERQNVYVHFKVCLIYREKRDSLIYREKRDSLMYREKRDLRSV